MAQKQFTFRQKIKTPKFWLKLSKEIVIFLALILGVSFYVQSDMVSGQAPQLTARTIDSKFVSLKNEDEKPTLVYFWGTWCGYCKVTSPMVETISKDYKVVSVAIASGTDSEINQYLKEKELDFNVVNDSTNHLSKQWGITGVPAIFIVDNNGKISSKTTGPTSTWGMKLRLWWAE